MTMTRAATRAAEARLEQCRLAWGALSTWNVRSPVSGGLFANRERGSDGTSRVWRVGRAWPPPTPTADGTAV